MFLFGGVFRTGNHHNHTLDQVWPDGTCVPLVTDLTRPHGVAVSPRSGDVVYADDTSVFRLPFGMAAGVREALLHLPALARFSRSMLAIVERYCSEFQTPQPMADFADCEISLFGVCVDAQDNVYVVGRDALYQIPSVSSCRQRNGNRSDEIIAV